MSRFEEYRPRARGGESPEATAHHREQIANIAYDVGYSALSSFNKAFKDIHNLTPTQYRNAALQNSIGYELGNRLQ